MEEFLASLRAEYGSYDGLAESLGVTDAVARLRRTVLVAGLISRSPPGHGGRSDR